ncbi:MAG: S1C family serine protease [Planctomycetaceae bacterium]|jgi:serine protease Do|nr:S1C family serine protease [Planctomycetaceae bacterium]
MYKLFFVYLLISLPTFCFGEADSLPIRQAVHLVSPFLVRIDTIGGHEKTGEELVNEGAGSGFLLDRQGFVLTSAFHFLHEPTSILLQFSDGTKKVARKVATDLNRMLTLLKVEDLSDGFLDTIFATPPEIRTKDSMLIGELCIAVGVSLSREEPNIAVGILSGKNRIWGKALQTDAAVSPNNYGGLLIDRQGKLLGLLVPLSMMSNELTAGVEMYDAGVGMAIPFEDIQQKTVLEQLKNGNDLKLGFTGIQFKENRIFIGEPVIDTVQPDSPADQAGIKNGDRIVAIDGILVYSALQVMMNLQSRYAGETATFRLLRQGQEKEISLVLSTPMKEKEKKIPKETSKNHNISVSTDRLFFCNTSAELFLNLFTVGNYKVGNYKVGN